MVVDSFRTVVRKAFSGASEVEMQSFIQRLSQFLTSWEATTFLVGEYVQEEIRDNPLFTIVDGIFWLSQVTERNSVVRKLQIMKLRGQASVPGLHTIRISDGGLQAFSRTLGLIGSKDENRRGVGVFPSAFPSWTRCWAAAFSKATASWWPGLRGRANRRWPRNSSPKDCAMGNRELWRSSKNARKATLQRAGSFGLNLKTPQEKGNLEILYLRPLDLSVDETMQEILDAIKRVGAKRLVIDSLVGFEMALAPGFRADFRESLYRMIGALTGAGITILSTVEVEDIFTSLQFSHYAISFLTDDIIRLRYVEIDGQLRKVMVVIKMRGGNHSKDIREYVITDKGVVVIHPRRTDYNGLTTGIPSEPARAGAGRRSGAGTEGDEVEGTMGAKPTPGTGNPPPDWSSLCLAVTEHAPLPMATVEGASHIVRYVNPAFCRLMDKPAEQLVGKPFREMLPEKDQCVTLLDRVFRTGKPESHTEQEHSKAASCLLVLYDVAGAGG